MTTIYSMEYGDGVSVNDDFLRDFGSRHADDKVQYDEMCTRLLELTGEKRIIKIWLSR